MPSASSMGRVDLRDHAKQILEETAADISTPQTTTARIAKSHGDGLTSEANTASQTHANIRMLSGFSIDQMVSEYPALRSIVPLLWSSQANRKDTHDQDIMRFNETIGNLLDFTRARVGTGIPLKLTQTNRTAVCEGIVREARACHPGKTILFEAQGTGFCEVDASLLKQAFNNLINNAIKHGSDTDS